MAMQENTAIAVNRGSGTIDRNEMTSVLSGSDVVPRNPPVMNEGDIGIDELNATSLVFPGAGGGSVLNSGGGNFGPDETFPRVLPNSPTFRVPANPLLPEEYSEILDYNAIQYLNGIFRTQIGRFVRVEQLVGSNTLQEYDGFLIGVGINYIILQEYATANIRIMDIYGIKNMYVYYTDVRRPNLGNQQG